MTQDHHQTAPQLLDVPAIAARLSVSERKVRELLKDELRAVRIGASVRAREDDLAAYIDSLTPSEEVQP